MLQTKSQSKNWQRMKFEDFADTSPSVKLERGKEYSFIPMEFVDGQSKFPVGTKRKEFTGGGSKFANGDTIFARITPCLENGKIAMVKSLKEGVGFGSTEFFVFRGKDGVSDSDFVYYLSRTDMIRDPAIKSMVGASGRQRADKSVVDSVQIMVPALSQQKEVADILSTYDDLIENNTKRIKILEEIAQAIYRKWFIYFRFPGHEKVKKVDSKTEFGKIPEGWEVKTTEDVFGVAGGGTPSKSKKEYWISGEIEWFTPSDLTSQRSVFALHSQTKISEDGLRNSSAKLFPAGSVMMTSRATIGEVAISVHEATTNQGFITCIPRDGFSSFQIYFWLKNNKELFGLLSGGATFKEITKSTFRKILLVVPESSVAKQFNETVAPIFEEILNLQKQLTQLCQARDLLLPKLITGGLTISN